MSPISPGRVAEIRVISFPDFDIEGTTNIKCGFYFNFPMIRLLRILLLVETISMRSSKAKAITLVNRREVFFFARIVYLV